MKPRDLLPLIKQHGWSVVDWYRDLAVLLTSLPDANITIESIDGVTVVRIDSYPIQLLIWHDWPSRTFTVQGKNDEASMAYQVDAYNDLAMTKASVDLIKKLKATEVVESASGPGSSMNSYSQEGWYPGGPLWEGTSETWNKMAGVDTISPEELVDLLSTFDNVVAMGRLLDDRQIQVALTAYNTSVAVYFDQGPDTTQVVTERSETLFWDSYEAIIAELQEELGDTEEMTDSELLDIVQGELEQYYTTLSRAETNALLEEFNLTNQVEIIEE